MKFAVGLVVSMFVLGSVSLLYTAYKDNKSLDQSLIAARRRADSLYLHSDSAEQHVEELKRKVDSAIARASELKKSVALTQRELRAKDREIERSHQATDSANKKIESLLASQKTDAKNLTELKTRNDQLEKDKKELGAKIVVITESNDKLNNALLNVKDNIRLEAVNQRGKLNVKGKKVKKIIATLSVPFELKKPTFKFFDPNGNQLPDQNGAFNFHSVNDANSTFADGYRSTKIELSYSLSKRLGRGTYKIEMLDGNKHIGNLMVSLR